MIDERIRSWVSPELGQQLVHLVHSAVAARTSVGVIGLIVAAYALTVMPGLDPDQVLSIFATP